MEQSTTIKNPLLETYGSVVSGFFAPDRPVGEPVLIFPGVASQSQADELPFKRDLEFFHPGDAVQQKIQKRVDELREALSREKQTARGLGDRTKRRAEVADRVRAFKGQAEGIEQVHFHLEAFRKAIATGDESLMGGNPFYDLSKQIFQLNLSGAVALWDSLQGDLAANAPEPVRLSRPLREIWARSKRRRGIGARLAETLSLWFFKGKPWLEVLLLAVSGFTTYLYVDAQLQQPGAARFLAGLVDSRQEGMLRLLLSVLASFGVGVTVLDYKRRLFLACAESGRVFKGIRNAFLLDPRWMVLATFLVLFSVKTNYDAVVTVLSKGSFFSEQSRRVHGLVDAALGTPAGANPDQPSTLHDLHARLEKRAGPAVAFFQAIPDGELTGRDPRKGPNYWSKYYVVEGGYLPGKKDVANSFKNVRYARSKDEFLIKCGLDLNLALAAKVKTVIDRYAADLQKSDQLIRSRLEEFDGMTRVEVLTLASLPTLLTATPTGLNQPLVEIAKVAAANRALYDKSLGELDQLFTSYRKVLEELDSRLADRFQGFATVWPTDAVNLPALQALQQAQVPTAGKKSFHDLKASLVAEHGSGKGLSLLGLLLFVSFAVDFAALLLYVRKTARQGAADRLVSQQIVQYLREWEDAFVELNKSFFYRPTVQQVFRGLTFPNETGVRNAFYKLLEEIEPGVKDDRDQSSGERFWLWWRELFLPTRTGFISGYLCRVQAIVRLLGRKKLYFSRVIEFLFPGLRQDKRFKAAPFLELFEKTEVGQSRDKDTFALELKLVAMADDPEAVAALAAPEKEPSKWSKMVGAVIAPLKRVRQAAPRRRGKPQQDQWTSMVRKAGSGAVSKPEKADDDAPGGNGHGPGVALFEILFVRAFLEPWERFTHNRRSWLREMSSVDEQSLEDLDTLHDFIPDFVKMLKKVLTNTLPVIQESLDPLSSICARFPETCLERGIANTAELERRFQELEKESLGMWGACVSHLLGDEGGAGAHLNKPDISSITDILADGGDISQYYDRIHSLMSDAEEAAAAAREIEEAAVNTVKNGLNEIKTCCDEVNRMLVKINFLGLELRKLRPLPHAKLRALNESSALLKGAPRVAEALLAERERLLKVDDLFNDENFKILSDLKNKANLLRERVGKVMDAVDK